MTMVLRGEEADGGTARLPLRSLPLTRCRRAQDAMERASEEFPGTTFTVNWHPYFLDVTLESKGLSKRENYRKKGMDDRALEKMERGMAQNFAGEGIEYSLDGDTGNTVDSHRLAAWTYSKFGAEAQDKLIEVMFRKFFGPQSGEPTGGNPADHMMLLSAAEEALNGVDLDEVKEFLEGEVGRQQVRPQPARLLFAANRRNRMVHSS